MEALAALNDLQLTCGRTTVLAATLNSSKLKSTEAALGGTLGAQYIPYASQFVWLVASG
jgi:hypothetical protein